MSVDPVQGSSTGIERQTPQTKVHVAPPPPSAVSGNIPKTEIAKGQNTSVPALFPEHEVKVQLDTAEDDIVIYQILDKQSGNLVLQVPSAAELRGIHQTQELLQQVAARGKAASLDGASVPDVTREGNRNGSKF